MSTRLEMVEHDWDRALFSCGRAPLPPPGLRATQADAADFIFSQHEWGALCMCRLNAAGGLAAELDPLPECLAREAGLRLDTQP